jgi:hypothetical protein
MIHTDKDDIPDEIQDIEIREIPDISEYDDIIKATKTGRLVVFVGAGVSKLVGLPLWREFSYNRLETVYQNGLIDYRTYCDLRSLEPKKLLTICEIFLKENKITPQSAKEVFKITNHMKHREVYEKLYSMNAIYVTTNYDECLDDFALGRVQDREITAQEGDASDTSRILINEKSSLGEVVTRQSDLLESKLRNRNVIHIHGSVNDESGMVVTLNDYMLHYGNLSKDNHPELSIFLDRVFNSKYVVLFIGYGLEEYEILEYMLSKVKNPENNRKHYLLHNCFKEDRKLVNLLRKYYWGFGVELIPYDTSRAGYDQLIVVINEWSKVLKAISNEQDYIQKMQFIDEVINDTTGRFNINVKAVIEMIAEDESLEKYLFSKIEDIKWLDILIENDFYNPKRVPTPIKKGDRYSTPYWVQVDYLNKLLNNIDNLNESDIIKILNILQSVSSYKDDQGNTIDNFNVWNEFADMISKIPNKYITIGIIELTRTWTKSMFKIDFVAEKICEVFLDKFLSSNDPEDFSKVQIIVDVATSLDADNNLIINDYYFLKLFADKTIELIAQKCSMDFLKNFSNKVSQALRKETSRNVIKSGNDEYLIKLTDDREKYVVSIYATDNPLSKALFNDSDTDCELLYVKEVEYCTDDEFTVCILEWLYQIFDMTEMQQNLQVIIRNLFYGLYSKGAYYSLYKPVHKHGNNTEELLLHFYKDVILKKFQIENIDDEKMGFLNSLLNNKYLSLIKIALYVIGNLPDKYLTVIWSNLDSESMKLVFEESYFGDELRIVFENIRQIDEGNASKILKLIESGPFSKYSSSDSERFKKGWKIKRLNALKHIPCFNEYLNKNFDDIHSNIKLGPAIGEVESGWSTSEAPLKEGDLDKMPNADLARFMSTFTTQDRWEGPTVEALARMLKEHVKNNPEKYDSDLIPFMNSPYYYIYEIFNGLLSAWKEKRLINWENLLDFMFKYVNRDAFWQDTFIIDDDNWNANHNWVLGAFADLICEGTRNDEWAMQYNFVKEAKHIILFILSRVINLVEETNDDYLHYVINSIKGRVLEALICMSLYLKRNLSKENRPNVEWDKELFGMFIKYLEADVIDSYILFGEYLPQFMYLDKAWCIRKIKEISYEDKNWEGFMTGYLYSGTIFKDIYMLMKTHYKYSINHNFINEEVIERLANHLALGYLNSFEEEIDNEVFNDMIENWDHKMINKILWHFGTYDQKLNNSKDNEEDEDKEDIDKDDAPKQLKSKIRQKIIEFWDRLYNRYKNIDTEDLKDEDKKLISDSIKLTGILESIDENSAEKIRFSIPYVEVNYNSHYFIEKISTLSSELDSVENRLIIGELLLDLVKDVVPIYPKEEIIKLVKYLYESKENKVKECADQICNIYAKHNIEFLRDICLENRDF